MTNTVKMVLRREREVVAPRIIHLIYLKRFSIPVSASRRFLLIDLLHLVFCYFIVEMFCADYCLLDDLILQAIVHM